MESLATISTWFWNPNIWLPKGYTWQDFKSHEKFNYPVWEDLWTYPFVIAVIAIGVRFLILNKIIYGPVALLLGFKDLKPRPVIPNNYLELLFKQYKNKVPNDELMTSAKKLGWSQRKVERWIRQRFAMTKVSKYTKFLECSWQFTYYATMFTYGIYVMIDKPWLYDLNKCWYDYPNHNVEVDVWWYYILSLSFYWSMIFTHFFETKRKDFWQMFFHHIVTICLITFSWTCNFTRVGTIILILHDCADIPLHAAKICIYLDCKALCDAVFALFAVAWVITRDCVYPLWIIKNTLFEATDIIPIFPAYYIFNSLLVTLFVLHIYWTYFIFKIIANTVVKGKMQDDRSSSDELQEEEIQVKPNLSDSDSSGNNYKTTELNGMKDGVRNLKNESRNEVNGLNAIINNN